jgi:multisubunit Na+/H+ antiporter MnhF subunit
MTAMENLLSTYIVPLAIAAVAAVLALGLYNMLRGGSPNLSQRLMRWRVILQFIAILIIVLAIWFSQRY